MKDERGQTPIIAIRVIIIVIGLFLLLQALSAFGETAGTGQIDKLANNMMQMIVGLILVILGLR